MKLTIERTPERFEAPINGVKVPTQIYRGRIASGIEVEVYVLSVVPADPANDGEAFTRECRAAGMQPTRDVMTVNVPMSRAEHIHRYGTEPPDE